MRLRFRIIEAKLNEARDGSRFASVRAVPTRHQDNRVLWEAIPTGVLELNGIIPRTADALRVGAEIELSIEEAS